MTRSFAVLAPADELRILVIRRVRSQFDLSPALSDADVIALLDDEVFEAELRSLDRNA